jgi:hypothetical protein
LFRHPTMRCIGLLCMLRHVTCGIYC